MSEPHQDGFDPRLLDLHLGHLSEAERADMGRQIAANPHLRAQEEALAGVFRALEAGQQESTPADLAVRALARVWATGPAPRVVRPADGLTRAVERRADFVIRLSSLRDMIAVAALIVLAVGIGVPSMLHVRDRQHRFDCSRNLAALGFGVQQYANTFASALPFAGWGGPNYSWRPSSDPGVITVPNRRHMYPLLQLAFIADPRLFLCPSQQHVAMPQDEIRRRSDFLEARNVSYAYQNMAGVRPSTNDDPDQPILSDDNPLFADGLPLLDPRRYLSGDPATQNSRAHGGAGQNILTIDGRVKWTTTPACGIKGDNIWTLRDMTEYTGHEGPTSATESHLLK